MDDNEIIEGLRGIVLVEPPLGFAPDDVVAKGTRRRRDRRIAIGAAVAVTSVAVAAVTFAANATDSGAGRVGGVPTSPRHATPSSATTSSGPTDLPTLIARNRQHLERVIGQVLPRATDIRVSDFAQGYPGSAHAEAMITTEVRFRDDAGPASFTLTVAGPRAAGALMPLDEQCAPPRGGDVPTLPDGQPLRCEKLPRPGDGTVVLKESGQAVGTESEPNLVRSAGLDAMHYRPDGTTVGIVNDDLVSGALAEEYGGRIGFRTRPPLTEQQLVALVTDPGFHLG